MVSTRDIQKQQRRANEEALGPDCNTAQCSLSLKKQTKQKYLLVCLNPHSVRESRAQKVSGKLLIIDKVPLEREIK